MYQTCERRWSRLGSQARLTTRLPTCVRASFSVQPVCLPVTVSLLQPLHHPQPRGSKVPTASTNTPWLEAFESSALKIQSWSIAGVLIKHLTMPPIFHSLQDPAARPQRAAAHHGLR